MEPSLHHSIFGKTGGKDIRLLSFFSLAGYFYQIHPLSIIACTPGIFNSEILFSFPFSDKIFCDIQHVMNRRNILRGVAQSNLSAPPAALIYHAVLCYTFAVSLSIIHETQIPFTFFREFFEKSFRGPLSQSLTALPALPKGEPIAARLSAAFTAQKPAQSSHFPCRCVGSPLGGAVERMRD